MNDRADRFRRFRMVDVSVSIKIRLNDELSDLSLRSIEHVDKDTWEIVYDDANYITHSVMLNAELGEEVWNELHLQLPVCIPRILPVEASWCPWDVTTKEERELAELRKFREDVVKLTDEIELMIKKLSEYVK